MRVAIVIRRLDPGRGGAEVWTAQLVRSLLADGHSVTVISEQLALEPAQRLEFLRIRLTRRTHDGRRLEFAAKAAAAARRLAADVTHDQGDGWYGDLFQPHGGTRKASLEHSLRRLPPMLRPWKRAAVAVLPRYRVHRYLEARQYAQAETIYVAVSELVAQRMVADYGIDPDRIRVVYNGVDTRRFCPGVMATAGTELRARIGAGPRTTVFALVATNFALKGGPQLIEAFARLLRRGHDARLIVAGTCPALPQRWLYWRRGLLRHVFFTGPLVDPRPIYAAADVYVHPTFGDACSLVVLEAMAMGLPVITTSANGAAKLVERFEAGAVLRDPADIDALARVLELACRWEWRFAHAAAARAARPWLDWQRNYRAIISLYEQVVRRKQRLAG